MLGLDRTLVSLSLKIYINTIGETEEIILCPKCLTFYMKFVKTFWAIWRKIQDHTF